jgi:hypothetical protein
LEELIMANSFTLRDRWRVGLANALTAVIILLIGAFFSLRIIDARQAQPRLIAGAEMPSDPRLSQGTVALLAADSPTFVLLGVAECPACRLQARNHAILAQRIPELGVAFRWLLAGKPASVEQFVRFAGVTYVTHPLFNTTVYRKLGVHQVPCGVLVGARQRILATWNPVPLDRDSLLYAIRELTRPTTSTDGITKPAKPC